jgi:membrane protein implicated in regulation of membrane protease activity
MIVLGLILIVMAVVLLLAEAHLSTGGLIGACAGVAAIAGAVLLLLAAGAGAVVVLVVGLCVAVACMSLLLLLRRSVLSPLGRVRPRTGREALIGHVGVVRCSGDGPEAQVFLDGSLWRAEPSPIHHEAELYDGERVVVERVNGLTLCVREAEEWECSP